jgi:hypothetical protein
MTDSKRPQSVQVFLSYGRRDASEFVDRLEKDLSKAGYRVWRDRSDLEAGHSWDTQLSAAIKGCQLVVAVLTPHAVRTENEESVCLDELAVARFQAPVTPIVPVMLIPCEPPFVIYRLQWIDFLGAASDEARYQESLDQLLSAVDKVARGVQQKPRHIQYEPLDFDLYLAAKTRAFVGREWLVRDVFQHLSGTKASTLLIVGEPGWGKTAFAGHLFATNPNGQIIAAHFCRADRLDTIDPRRFVQSIAAMTALRIPDYADQITTVLDAKITFSDETEMFERLFIQPLAKLDATKREQIPRYLLIDGLDEAFLSAGRSDLPRLLARTSNLLPDWLHYVVITRDAFGILELFPSPEIIRLDGNDPRNRADVKRLIESRLEAIPGMSYNGDGGMKLSDSPLISTIDAKAEGNALVASQLLGASHIAGFDAGLIANLPRELTALYRALMERRIDPAGPEWADVRGVFEMVLASDTALPIPLVTAARGDAAGYRTRNVINAVSDLLAIQNDAIQIYHQTFREFLARETTPFFTNPTVGARTLADFSTSPERMAQLAPELKRFCRQHLLSWVLRTGDIASYSDELVSIYQNALPDRPFNATIGANYTSDEDQDLIRMCVGIGMTGNLLAIASLVMQQAWLAMEASGVLNWLNKTEQPPPEESARIPIMRAVFKSVALTGFALEWMELVQRAAQESDGQIQAILRDNDRLRYVFGWFDLGIGSAVLEISRAFEDYGTVIIGRWSELRTASMG